MRLVVEVEPSKKKGSSDNLVGPEGEVQSPGPNSVAVWKSVLFLNPSAIFWMVAILQFSPLPPRY